MAPLWDLKMNAATLIWPWAKWHSSIKPNLSCRYRDDLRTAGKEKLLQFTDYLNPMYPTIKFTIVFFWPALKCVRSNVVYESYYIVTDVYAKPTDNHIYLDRRSSHPSHCSKAIPFGISSRIRRNCSSLELFDKRSIEYQSYLTLRGYKLKLVKKDFDKVRSTPRDTF